MGEQQRVLRASAAKEISPAKQRAQTAVNVLGGRAPFCIVHRLKDFFPQMYPRHLWNATAHKFLRRLRAQLAAVGNAKVDRITLKTFRSSMATQLAKDGKKVEAILTAGGWACAAVLNLHEIDDENTKSTHRDKVDPSQFRDLQHTIP